MNQSRPDIAWQVQTLAESAKQLAERGEHREAEQIYRQILEVAPYHVRALNFLAVQAILRGELDASERHLEQALRAAPDRSILHKNLALVNQARGKLEEALAGIERAIELRPEISGNFLHKGDVLEAMGRTDEAVMAYCEAWRGFPDADALAAEESVPPILRGLLQRAAGSMRGAQIRMFEDHLAPLRERHGASALQRITEAADIYLGLKRNPYQHALQRPSLLYLPGLKPRSFFDRAEFTWTEAFESNTDAIRDELATALGDGEGFAPYVQAGPGVDPLQWRELNGSRKWSSMHLLKGGVRDEANCRRCPQTLRALEALPLADVPGHAPEALFSVLEPGTHIPAHFGLGNYKLAVHLPLIIPPDCSIRVGNETRGWTEGECLIFDDSFQHEAWNRSERQRAVLIIDVWHPEVTAAERDGITALSQALAEFNRRYRTGT